MAVLVVAPHAATTKKASPEAEAKMQKLFAILLDVLAIDLFDGVSVVMQRLVISIDETGISLLPRETMRWVAEGSKRVPGSAYDDKRAYTCTLCFSMTGEIAVVQLIYDGKTSKSLPNRNPDTPADWLIDHTSNHWSNQEMKNKLIDVLARYHDKVMSAKAFSVKDGGDKPGQRTS